MLSSPEHLGFFYLPETLAKQERLKCIRGVCSPFKTRALAPALKGGPEFAIPSLSGLILVPVYQPDCGWAWLSNQSRPERQSLCLFDVDWGMASYLPCFDTHYDRMLRNVSRAYESLKEGYDARLLKSLQGANDLGFLDVIEWQMARAGGNH